MTASPTEQAARIARNRIQSKLLRYRHAGKLLTSLASVELLEEALQHGAGDRRRRRPAVPAVLHEHRPGDLRIVLGREPYEPCVVPLVLRQLVGVDVARHLEHLGGPGLRADV